MKGVVVIAALVALSAGALASGCSKELSTTLLPDFKDCAAFWQCADGVTLLQTCPQGLHFSARLQRCTLPVFARCQAVAGDAHVHTGFMSDLLDTLRNVISRKAQPVPLEEDELPTPPELPTGDVPAEQDTIRRFPDAEAGVAGGDTEEAEKSNEAGSQNGEQKSADEEVEEMEQEEQEKNGKEGEQDESERTEEKIDEEEDEVEVDKQGNEEKINDISEDVVTENDGENKQDSKKDATVVKKQDEEEEDENKKKSKDVKRIENESKKHKPEEKEKDSDSDAESEEED